LGRQSRLPWGDAQPAGPATDLERSGFRGAFMGERNYFLKARFKEDQGRK
jgi:hypothetical protein